MKQGCEVRTQSQSQRLSELVVFLAVRVNRIYRLKMTGQAVISDAQKSPCRLFKAFSDYLRHFLHIFAVDCMDDKYW